MNDMSTKEYESPYWKPEPWSFRAAGEKFWGVVKRKYERHPVLTILWFVLAVFLIYTERHLYQQYVFVPSRIYAAAAFAVLLSAVISWWVFAKWHGSHRAKLIVGSSMLVITLIIAFFGKEMHDYVSQYWRYTTLQREFADLQNDPTTDHERILPLNGVHTLARERMNETEEPSVPDLVRIGSEYRWTLAIEPSHLYGQFFHNVEEILDVSATEATPDFSRRRPERVRFIYGENLIWSRNIKTCTRLAFGPTRMFSYEPGNVLRMKDDAGKWVQVVTLIKWVGWIFPRPEFGGVQVVEQGSTNKAVDWLSRNLWGCGKYVAPHQIKDHKFLVGQNLMPYAVTRYMAASLRFQAGFLGPLRYTRIGDLRIADMPDDVNQQPFTLFFKMPNGESKLYQYFALEPRDRDKQGLAMSFYYPADGIGGRYVMRHYDRRIPIGVTTVADQVRASRKHYDWSHNAAVEVRPYTHAIADSTGKVEPRFMWMVTVVSIKERKPGVPVEFASGSNPEIALVDAYWNDVVWVDSKRPEKWPEQLREALAETWAR